jgi:hypothetical protein
LSTYCTSGGRGLELLFGRRFHPDLVGSPQCAALLRLASSFTPCRFRVTGGIGPSTDQSRALVLYLIIQCLALAEGMPCIRGGPCFVARLTPYVGTACRVWIEVRAVSHFTSGQSAKRARVNVETIRYDERCRPLPQAPRRGSGYRQYSQDDVVSLRFISPSTFPS